MLEQPRSIGLDVHREYVMIAGVDGQQQVILEPCKVPLSRFSRWSAKQPARHGPGCPGSHQQCLDYDQLTSQVDEVKVANVYKVKLISSSRAKTDRHDAVVLAQLLAANLLPAVWVPPVEVRELRSLIAYRQRLVRDRTAAKNRLHSVLYRHNLQLPAGDPFSEANQAWWQTLPLSRTEQLRVRYELAHIQHLSTLLAEVETENAHLSVEEPWGDQLAFVMQLPGVGLLSGMTILSAIGDIRRFPSASQLVGYSELASSVHDSGKRVGQARSPNRDDENCGPCWWNVPGPLCGMLRTGGHSLSVWRIASANR